jgi:hypothetical protein
MLKTPSHERVFEDDLERALSTPKEIVLDESTARRLDELCSQMAVTCGQIEAALQLAAENESKRDALIETASHLAARGRKSTKMFLSEWSVLVEESKSRDNSRRVAKDSEGRTEER